MSRSFLLRAIPAPDACTQRQVLDTPLRFSAWCPPVDVSR
nr:MAG TPA: hypothetical protein [Caudoviricetes sp.]